MKIKYLPVVLVCAFLALWPKAEAVVPPPAGGYPNFTTAAGDHALQALTSGVGNTAVGTFSLFSVTTGNFNTAVGAGALDLNTADSNTATGAAALFAQKTRPMEQPHLHLTRPVSKTRPAALSPCLITASATSTPPLVSKLSLAILKAFLIPLSAFRHSKTTSTD